MTSLAIGWSLATLLVGIQAPRPATLISEVRAAIAAHDLAKAETLIVQRRDQQGTTSEGIEAGSWRARDALAEGQADRAEQYATEAQRLAVAAIGSRSVDEDPKLATALGAAIAAQRQTSAGRGARSGAIIFLERELKRYATSGIGKRFQKHINRLTLEGRPAPP